VIRKSAPKIQEPIKPKEVTKKKEAKIDNWFMRQFNSFFEENSSELD